MTKSIIWSIVGPGLLAHCAIICGWKKRIIAGAGAQRGQLQVGDLEFAGRGALRDHLADGRGDALHMGDADVPALLHRDLDHLVQLGIADIALGVHAMDGLDQLAQARPRRPGPGRDPLRLDLDLAHQGPRHAFVDRLLRIEEAIDVGGAHPQFLGDVGDRGLLVADLPEQTLRHHENPFPGVGFDMFRNQRHVSCSMFNYSAASASGIACGPLILHVAAQDQAARPGRFLPGSCGTTGRKGPAGTARSGRLQQTNRP